MDGINSGLGIPHIFRLDKRMRYIPDAQHVVVVNMPANYAIDKQQFNYCIRPIMELNTVHHRDISNI